MAAPDVEYRCFVGGLAWATDDRSLEAAFSTYGEILESKGRPRSPTPCFVLGFFWVVSRVGWICVEFVWVFLLVCSDL